MKYTPTEIGDLNTYDDMDTKYILYSEDDIGRMIGKLKNLLGLIEEE